MLRREGSALGEEPYLSPQPQKKLYAPGNACSWCHNGRSDSNTEPFVQPPLQYQFLQQQQQQRPAGAGGARRVQPARRNKKRSCVGKSGCKKKDAETDQEEKKELVETLAEKKLSTERYTGRNDEREKNSGQKEISDDRRH
ncbi:hypothetical protein ANN_05965 [Periplaneta americana]|uniref:Uncharacterized protein n=1 Tax=Periplaneta americana TaxID=6978 RepID=A0ABQ8TCC0_PERAM|nr:hypothetical protein ANN_05965 [Periplaneta americana]